jgi:dipeptidyl-peptidase-4
MNKPVIALLLFSAASAALTAQTKKLALEDIWSKPIFKMEVVPNMQSMKNGVEYCAMSDDGRLLRYDYATGNELGVIFNNADIKNTDGTTLKYDNFKFSPDESKLLLATATEYIYRHSTIEENFIFDIATKTTKRLSVNGKQRLATFSPDGKHIAFVRDNNIFITHLENGQEEQVTRDGEKNKIINGGTDWVYEEEFALPNGLYWAPDSKKLAFYKFDESAVKEFSMAMYGTLYPGDYTYKYPKAGETNSTVSIHIYNLEKKNTLPVDVGPEKDQYIARIKWTNDPNQLTLYRLNRLQNKGELLLANASTGMQQVILTETSDKYIEVGNELTFLADGKNFIWSSERTGRKHLYLCSLDGKTMKQLTSGDFNIITFYGVNEKTKTFYYQSNEEGTVTRTVYSQQLNSNKKTRLSERRGSNSAQFSRGMNFYINTYSSANVPNYITLHDATGKRIKMLKSNADLQKKTQEYGFVNKTFFTFKNSTGTELNGWMMKPADFDSTKKYPVYMFVYGGPGRTTVNDAWEGADFYWHQFLTQNGYIVVSVDNRGTEYRGTAFKQATYMQMGRADVDDQIDAAKYLGTLRYVDKTRIGIQGWSYGGYMSAMCLMRGGEYFKAGIAVAPVTNWRYYDSIYTERYMGLPKDNAKGYDENAPTGNAKNLNDPFLLIHGTADDNVHFQNSVELVNALVNANKQFDFYMYPDKNHGIRGGNSRLHLYTKVFSFIQENL